MIVQCESCETRFHVADARIPAKGARVRCSRCHHRFHITPSSGAPAAGNAPADGSAARSARGAEPREEDGLDNPEFLFDGRGAEKPAKRPVRPEANTVEVDQPLVSESEAAPAPPLEERVVETRGKTAQEMLDAGPAKLHAPRFELGGELQGPGDPEYLGGDAAAEPERTPTPRPAPKPAPAAHPAAAKPDAPKTPPPRPAAAEMDALASEFGDLNEDDDSSFGGWDPLSTPVDDNQPKSVFDALTIPERSSSSAPIDLAGAAATPQKASVFDQPDLPKTAKERRRGAPEMPSFDPEAASPLVRIARIAAVVVGLALLGAAARLVGLQTEEVDAPETVQAAGWVAADLETFLARDALGERVLVVRGSLFPEGAAPPPRVEVTVLTRAGEVLAEPAHAWLERIDDAEVAPEALSLRLASSESPIAGLGQQVTGFTAVLRDPPPEARRVHVALVAGSPRSPGTATAEPAPEALPAPAASSELATPSGDAAPAAEPDVLPAAPAEPD